MTTCKVAEKTPSHVAFVGHELLLRGDLGAVVSHCKSCFDRGETERIVVFDDESGRVTDVDLSGSEEEVLTRLPLDPTSGAAGPRRRGRPRLGVVCREVSLLPRHWDWLAEQRGGASAALRRLVEEAKKSESGEARARRAVDAAHRFMWDIAGNQPDFEEATRALFAFELDEFEATIAAWPRGLREQLGRYVARARTALSSPEASS